MSDEKQRLVDDFIDDWLAAIDSYRQYIDCPKNPVQRFAAPLGHATAAVRRAREEGDQQVLLFAVVVLAKLIVTVQSAFSDWAVSEYDRLDEDESRLLDKMKLAALSLAANDSALAAAETARRVALAAGRKTQQEKRKAKLEAARPEYERLLAAGASKRRASEIIGPRYGLNRDALRKQRT